MVKQQIIKLAEQWGYIFVYRDYSRKAKNNVWTVKVPTTGFKNNSSFVRTRKILENENLDKLLEEVKNFFTGCDFTLKVIIRENKYSPLEDAKELFIP